MLRYLYLFLSIYCTCTSVYIVLVLVLVLEYVFSSICFWAFQVFVLALCILKCIHKYLYILKYLYLYLSIYCTCTCTWVYIVLVLFSNFVLENSHLFVLVLCNLKCILKHLYNYSYIFEYLYFLLIILAKNFIMDYKLRWEFVKVRWISTDHSPGYPPPHILYRNQWNSLGFPDIKFHQLPSKNGDGFVELGHGYIYCDTTIV